MARVFLDPGQLDAQLKLEAPAEASDGQGGVGDGWMPVADLWGRVEPLRARSREEAEADKAPVSHRVTIRYREDLCHGMRFLLRGRPLVVRGVYDPDERRRYLICDCEEARP